ncbi:dihydrofolate reductase [archaeon]|nr:dihydrofolate reductase [archaeon]
MSLIIIASVSENNVIGLNNGIPWKISEDMKRFRRLTLDHPVIMGENTFLSLPKKFSPLPKRKNIVLSQNLEPQDGIYIARNIQEAIELTGNEDSYVIGGAQVYRSFLPLSDKMELTRINRIYTGDAFFPEVKWKEWKLIGQEDKRTDDGIGYSFLTYKRI